MNYYEILAKYIFNEKINEIEKECLDKAIESFNYENIKDHESLLKHLNPLSLENKYAIGIFINLVGKIVLQELMNSSIHWKYDKWKLFTGQTLIFNGSYVKHQVNGFMFNGSNVDSKCKIPYCNAVEQKMNETKKKYLNITESYINPYGIKTYEDLIKTLEFISNDVYKSYSLFFFDNIFGEICSYFTNTNYHGSTINDEKSTNNYDCAHALNLIAEKMTDLTANYVIDPVSENGKYAKVCESVNPADMVVLLHPEVLQKWEMGTLPGIFNDKNVDILRGVPKSNFIALPLSRYKNSYDAENGKTEPWLVDTPYIDNKTIILMHKKSYAIHFRNINCQQNNDSTKVFCLQYVGDIIKFELGLIYKCNNLTTTKFK